MCTCICCSQYKTMWEVDRLFDPDRYLQNYSTREAYHRNRSNKVIHHDPSICQGKASTRYYYRQITCNQKNEIFIDLSHFTRQKSEHINPTSKTYFHQIPGQVRRHRQLSLEMILIWWHLPEPYEALKNTLCGPIPCQRPPDLVKERKRARKESERPQMIIHAWISSSVYLSPDWSGKGRIANITIQSTNVAVHHCFLAFSWTKPDHKIYSYPLIFSFWTSDWKNVITRMYCLATRGRLKL